MVKPANEDDKQLVHFCNDNFFFVNGEVRSCNLVGEEVKKTCLFV